MGCGYHLVSAKHVKDMVHHLEHAKDPKTFNTANGPTPTYEVARLRVSELEERILPYVLEPPRRC